MRFYWVELVWSGDWAFVVAMTAGFAVGQSVLQVSPVTVIKKM